MKYQQFDRHPRRRWANAALFGCMVVATLNSLLLGYDVGIMAAASTRMKEDFSMTAAQVETMIGILNLVAVGGLFVAGQLADTFGRKKTMVVAAMVFVIGALSLSLAQTYSAVIAGRVIIGLGVGSGLLLPELYACEVAPAHLRGRLVTVGEVGINGGILLGYLTGFLMADLSWRWMIGIGIVPPVLLLAALLFLPESPRWLVAHNRTPEAYSILLMLRGNEEEVESELRGIQESTARERSVGWKHLLMPNRAMAARLCVALGIAFFQQASGTEAFVYYAPTVLQAAGVEKEATQLQVTVFMGLGKTLGVLVTIVTGDLPGARPLLLSMSSAGLGTCMAVLAGTIGFSQPPIWITALLMCAAVFFFSTGLGPLMGLVASEQFPTPLRGRGISLAWMVNRLTAAAISMTFLSMAHAMTVAGVLCFGASMAFLGLVFCLTVVPDAAGMSLEQINKNPTTPETVELQRYDSLRSRGLPTSHSDGPGEGVVAPPKGAAKQNVL